MENCTDNPKGISLGIVPKLDKRWWDLIIRHNDLWSQLSGDVVNVIRQLLKTNDPKFIKQKHLPMTITQPGKYLIVEDMFLKGENTFIKIVDVQGVELNGRNCQIVMENSNSNFVLIDHSVVDIHNIRIGKVLTLSFDDQKDDTVNPKKSKRVKKFDKNPPRKFHRLAK